MQPKAFSSGHTTVKKRVMIQKRFVCVFFLYYMLVGGEYMCVVTVPFNVP